MKKSKLLLAIGLAASLLIGCSSTEGTPQGAETGQADGGTSEDGIIEMADAEVSGSEDNSGEAASFNGVLETPVLKDGVTVEGMESVDVYFEWEPVPGADGYEVCSESKFYEESEYRDPVTTEVTDPSFYTGAQDLFDFRIKVRAFKSDGAEKKYSEFSDYAYGSSYTPDEIAGDGSTLDTDHSYDDIIREISNGLNNGFTDEQKKELDISESIYDCPDENLGFGYRIKDVDGDGVNELLICGYDKEFIDGDVNGIIFDMFTVKNNKITHVFSGDIRDRYYLCYNGMIANEPSVGSSDSCYVYYKYKDGFLEVVESVYSSMKDGSDEVAYYHSDKKPGEGNAEEISFDEAERITKQNKYIYQGIVSKAFDNK